MWVGGWRLMLVRERPYSPLAEGPFSAAGTGSRVFPGYDVHQQRLAVLQCIVNRGDRRTGDDTVSVAGLSISGDKSTLCTWSARCAARASWLCCVLVRGTCLITCCNGVHGCSARPRSLSPRGYGVRSPRESSVSLDTDAAFKPSDLRLVFKVRHCPIEC